MKLFRKLTLSELSVVVLVVGLSACAWLFARSSPEVVKGTGPGSPTSGGERKVALETPEAAPERAALQQSSPSATPQPEVALEAASTKAQQFSAGIAAAPPESAVIRPVDASTIPPETLERLQSRLAARKEVNPKPPVLPPVDPSAAHGLVRPLGEDRIISAVPITAAPAATEKKLEERTVQKKKD